MPAQTPTKTATSPTVQQLAHDLYTNHQPRLLAIATRNAPTKADAEEALHDAFELFINHFQPSSGAPPLAWITLTLKRRCWALYRRQLTTSLTPHSDHHTTTATPYTPTTNHHPTPDDVIELTDIRTHTRKNITQLKPAERRAITYQALGYSYTEIAQLTGWTYTKVNRCITEGRAKLRSAP
jgi:RNA polymerase sigma factor (sigma-70 family)